MLFAICQLLTAVLKKKAAQRAAFIQAFSRRKSEADLWPAHELEVVVDAVVPIHLVARFQADSECAGVEFYAATRIEHAVGITVPDGTNLVGKCSGSHRTADSEIQQTAFNDYKSPHWASG